jgi:hypothetical protein
MEQATPDTVWVFVAGWCRRVGCGRPFAQRVDAANTPNTYPTTCSRKCQQSMQRMRRRVREAVPWCWACWRQPQTHELLCSPCFDVAMLTADAMCRGKVRLSRDAAVARADAAACMLKQTMNAYPCPVCDWWHTGTDKRCRAEYKRRALTVSILVMSMPPAELAGLRRRWEPRQPAPTRRPRR